MLYLNLSPKLNCLRWWRNLYLIDAQNTLGSFLSVCLWPHLARFTKFSLAAQSVVLPLSLHSQALKVAHYFFFVYYLSPLNVFFHLKWDSVKSLWLNPSCYLFLRMTIPELLGKWCFYRQTKMKKGELWAVMGHTKEYLAGGLRCESEFRWESRALW